MNSLTSAVAAVVTDDAGRVLLCQQSQGHRRWGLPGGRIRREESPIHAAERDILEETGMAVEIVDLVGIYHLTGDGSAAGPPALPAQPGGGGTSVGPGHRSGNGRHRAGRPASPLPDVLVHVFRGRVHGAEATVNAPGRICRLSWHDPDDLPQPMTPTTRTAIADATAGRSGVLRNVHRDAEPELPEATDAPPPPTPLTPLTSSPI
ncbi:NUDIX hydrolase [Plantactinospora sp. GCM10030261]|uniref:NUDIX hydrolase n=1 Tax=Plantactinospora sp. GCM10030261 TaxID=3273420 RepID=UPI00361A0238